MSTFADLLFRTADGVFAVDAKQRTVLWNAGCAQLFGVPSSAALGRPCNEIVRGLDPGGRALCNGQCCVVRMLQGEGVPPKGFPLRARDSAGKTLALSVNLVLVPSQRMQSWTCVHLLYRGDAPDVLETLGDTLKQADGGGDGDGKKPRVASTLDRSACLGGSFAKMSATDDLSLCSVPFGVADWN